MRGIIRIVGVFCLCFIPFLLIVGFARKMVGLDDFLPSSNDLYIAFSSMPNFFERCQNDLTEIGSSFSNLNWNFDNMSGYVSHVSELWDNVYELFSFFNALGNSIILAFKYVGQFFVNVGNFFVAFSSVFVLLYHIILTPINFITWLFSVLFSTSYVPIG